MCGTVDLVGVEPILRHGDAVLDDALDRVVGTVDEKRELLALPRGEGLEHVVRRILPAGRPTDPDANADRVAGAEGPADAAQSIVATVASALLHAQGSERDVEFVVDERR